MLRRLILLPAAASAALLGFTGPASATVTETTHQMKLVETFVDVVPTCDASGESYVITTTTNTHEHITMLDNGGIRDTFTQSGKVSAVPEDGTGPSYTGVLSTWGNFHQDADGSNLGGFTFNLNLKGSDGSTVHHHENGHSMQAPDGTVREFFRCH